MTFRIAPALGGCAIYALACLVPASVAQAAEANAPDQFARAVTTVKAGRTCFADTLQVTGTVVPRNEVLVRSEREGMQISQVLVENGDTVVSGQILVRLRQPDGRGSADAVQAPAAGVIYTAAATVGGTISAGRDPLFRIARQGEMELMGETPVDSMSRLRADLPATVEIVGVSGELAGKVRLISTSVNPASQLGKVSISIGADQRIRVGAFGKGIIRLAERCAPSLPLSAVLYGSGGQIVQVVRNDRVETRRVVVGIVRNGEAEIREGVAEGDVAVARAGAFVRDGDRVYPVALKQPQ